MARSTLRGVVPGTEVRVARDGRRRAHGTVVRLVESPKHGPVVEYRDWRTGQTHIAQIADVAIVRKVRYRNG